MPDAEPIAYPDFLDHTDTIHGLWAKIPNTPPPNLCRVPPTLYSSLTSTLLPGILWVVWTGGTK